MLLLLDLGDDFRDIRPRDWKDFRHHLGPAGGIWIGGSWTLVWIAEGSLNWHWLQRFFSSNDWVGKCLCRFRALLERQIILIFNILRTNQFFITTKCFKWGSSVMLRCELQRLSGALESQLRCGRHSCKGCHSLGSRMREDSICFWGCWCSQLPIFLSALP